MESAVFKTYMRDEIIQKSIIFSRAFNLNINNWKSELFDRAHPYRIYFYSDYKYVGYVDSEVDKIGNVISPKSEHPFVFFTPLGKVEGTLTSRYISYFVFKMPLKNSKIDFLEGLVTLIKTGNDKQYVFSARLSFYQNKKLVINLNVGDASSNYFELQRFEEPFDTISFGHSLNMIHSVVDNHESVEIARAKVNLDGRRYSISEGNHLSYSLPLKFKDDVPEEAQFGVRMQYVDLQPVYAELSKVDPDFFIPIDTTRDDLVFMANGITPINLYDLMTTMAYSRSMQYIKGFAHTHDVSLDLENNPVLKRMREKEKDYFGLK